MSITIIEKKEGFTYDKRNFNFGDSLIEFANQNFSELEEFVTKPVKNILITQTEAFKYIFDFLNDKSKSYYNSIHFNLLKNTLNNYYETMEENAPEDEFGVPFAYSKVELKNFMNDIDLFFSQLFDCQKRINNIIRNLDDNILKKENKSICEKVADLYNHNNSSSLLNNTNNFSIPFAPLSNNYHFFIPLAKEKPYPFENCEELSHINLVFDKKMKPNYELCFSTIQEFCNFELKKFLDNKIPLAICPECQKPFVKLHGNQIYCSDKCKTIYNDKNSSNFYKLYRKRYVYLNNKHNSGLYKNLTPENFPKEKLKKLYSKYENLDDTDNKLLEEFAQKLKNIK